MNKIIRDALIFAAGFGCGAFFMHTLFRKKYEEQAEKEINDVRDHYQQKEAEMDKVIEEKATKRSIEQLTGPYRTETEPEDLAEPDEIEILQPDEVGDTDYEVTSLTYYADGKLVYDGEDKPVDEEDIPKILGTEALHRIGEFAPSMVCVRNNRFLKDCEVLQVRQNWCDLYPEEEE